jgi:type II secretory pathway component GspD/PulD (secretin)
LASPVANPLYLPIPSASKVWRRINPMRMNMNLLAAAALAAFAAPLLAQEGTGAADTDPRKQEAVNKLNSMRLSVDFKDNTLDEALGFIRDFSGLNIVVDAEVLTKASPDQLKVSLRVKDLLLKSCLKLMLSARDLTAVYNNGVILVVPKGRADRNVYLQIYEVRDLLVKIQDFAGPKVELVSPSKGGSPLIGASFTLEEPRSTITEEFITEMIKQNTGDRSWDENQGASITLTNGMLIVSQSRRVHAEVKQLINLLRQFK